MSEPIDLGLVELRCRLRGWAVLPGEGEVCVERPEGDLWLSLDADPTILRGDAAMLALPRWTLDRLITHTPEGWTANWAAAGAVALDHWRDDTIEASVIIGRESGGDRMLITSDVGWHVVGAAAIARLADRHRAVSELLIILAEVEP
jgi:hypothetical protein